MTETGRSFVEWREVARAAPGGIVIQEGETLVYLSPAFEDTVGLESGSLVGEPWRVLFDPAEVERIASALNVARTDGRWQGETWLEPAERVAVDVTLSVPEASEETVIWSVSERETQATREGRHTLPPWTSTQLARTALDAIDDVVYVIDEDGRSWFWNETLAETTGYDHDQIATMHPKEFIPADQHEYVPGLRDAIESIEDRRARVDILTKEGDRIPHEFSGTTFEDPETGRTYRCGVARDISDRLERERELERQRDELATLNRINDLLFETARELIRTSSREAVTRTVCERLVGSPLYRFACVGERSLGEDRIDLRVSAGFDRDSGDFPDGFVGGAEDDLATQAMESGTIQVARGSDLSVGRRPEATGGVDVEAVAAVPLQHGGTVYGALVVGADRPDAFGPEERDGFEVLGRLVGVVVHAARSHELLFADAVVELEFDMTGCDSFFVDAAADLGCFLDLDGYVSGADGWVLYLTVQDAPLSQMVAAMSDDPRIERVRPISENGTSARLEVTAGDSTLLGVISDAGATARSAVATPDEARLVVETSVDADARRIVRHVLDVFPGAELLATRERDREVTTVGRPGGVLDELTSRQREVLEAAYQAGYFDWPRESTAEEVAEPLDLTAPTLHGHLRKAEHAILSELLDDG